MEQICSLCESKKKLVDELLLVRLRESGILLGAQSICEKCVANNSHEWSQTISAEIAQLEKNIIQIKANLQEELGKLEMFTFPPPAGLEYENKGFISSVSAMGTGPFVDFFSSFTDFFGAESESYHEKIRLAQDNCLNRLRRDVIATGANALYGVQITYTELTAGKGMILVCACGTALKVNNGVSIDLSPFQPQIGRNSVKIEKLKEVLRRIA